MTIKYLPGGIPGCIGLCGKWCPCITCAEFGRIIGGASISFAGGPEIRKIIFFIINCSQINLEYIREEIKQ